MNRKEYLASISQSRQAQSAVTIASGNGTQIGDDIPDNKVRKIWRIIASADDGSEQNLEIMQGDSSDADRNSLTVVRVPDVSNAPPLVIGGDPENPIFTCRPDTRTGLTPSTQQNQIALAHETSAINVTIDYYDEP